MTKFADQLKQAAGSPEESVDLGVLHGRARTRRVRRRAAWAGSGLAVLGVLALLVSVGVGADPAPPQQLRVADGSQGAPEGTALAPDTTLSPSTSSTTASPDPSDVPPSSTVVTTVPRSTTVVAPPDTTVPANTTSTTPPSPNPTTTEAPAAPEPSSGTATVSGRFVGYGPPWEGPSDRCSQLTHRMDADVTMYDGEAWTLHEDYCGFLNGDQWRGEGTFTFTTSKDDTLFGTFTSRATLPTVGEPYTMTVTGGTGALAGQTGTCHVDNHVRVVSPTVNEQSGTFICTLAHNSADPRG